LNNEYLITCEKFNDFFKKFGIDKNKYVEEINENNYTYDSKNFKESDIYLWLFIKKPEIYKNEDIKILSKTMFKFIKHIKYGIKNDVEKK